MVAEGGAGDDREALLGQPRDGLGFLLTQYTITGFDASAHISEETHGASEAAAKGVWRSIFYSALIGWVVLLAITFAVTNIDAANEAEGFAPSLLVEALGSGWGASSSPSSASSSAAPPA